jgi:iron complex outermembrane receptor protein
VYAQASKPDISDMSLEDLMNIEVYSASKHLQKSEEAPSSVTVITAAEIRTYGYRTLADILRSVRSFYVTYDRNYSYVGVRGLGRPGDYNTRILLLIDGHRLNDNIYDQGMVGTEFPLDVDLIDRVEIIRGPVSSLYGANAFFGVINIITRHGNQIKGLELSSSAASFATYNGRLTYGGEFHGIDFLASGSFLGSQGHARLFYPEFSSPQTNYGYAIHSDDDQLASALLTASFRDFTFQGLYGNRDKAIPTAAYGTLFDVRGTRTIDTHTYFDLLYKHTYGGWALLERFFYDRYTYKGFYNLNPAGILDRNLDFADGKWWGTELQIGRDLPARNHATFGGEYRNNLRQDQSNYDANPYHLYLDDRRHSFTGGMFLQDEWLIAPKVTLNAGVRYDYYNLIASSTNPRAAVIYRPWSRTALKFVYGTAYRVPNVYELYYWAPGTTPALKLSPERIRTIEFVWEQALGGALTFSSAAYHNRINGLISQQELPDGTAMFRNLDKAHSTGLEFEANGKFAYGVQGRLSYSLQRTINPATSQELSNSPNHLVKLNIASPVLTPHLQAGIDAQYTSSRTTLSGSRVSGFPVVNLTLMGRNLGKHLQVSASTYNLFDRRYFDPGAAEHRQSAIQQDGRSFRLKLTWTWEGRK